MKHLHILLLFFTAILTGCTTTPTDDFQSIPPDAVHLSSACAQAKAAIDEHNFDEAQRILENALSGPFTSITPDDSLLKYARLALSHYKQVAIEKHNYEPTLHFLSTLQSPIFRNGCLYELLAIRAHLNQLSGNSEQAIALIDSFASLPDPDDGKRVIQYSEMAGSVYFYCGHDIQKAILVLEKAVKAYQKGTDSPYIGRIYARLGHYYREGNDYLRASEANQAAIKFYQNDTVQQQKNGLIMAYGEQSNLYLALNMYNRALELNQQACQYSIQQDSFGLGDLYRFRSDIFQKTGVIDSVLYYLHSAYQTSTALGLFKGAFYSKMALAEFYLTLPDSVHRALEITQVISADTAKVPLWLKLNFERIQGQAFTQNGQAVRGIRLMEKAVAGYSRIGMEEIRSANIEKLMQAYLKNGMHKQFISNYPYYKSTLDSLQHDNEIRALASANIHFETQKKEQENQLLAAEITLKNAHLHNFIIIALIIFLSILCLGVWLLMRQRALKLRLQLREKEKQLFDHRLHEQSERLQQLIASRQELNNHNEELLRQLAEVQATHEKTCDLDHVMESLQPRLLTNTEEEQFRTAFSSLYPTVLHQLRSVCPRATRADELLCMLIVLKQTNEEISRTLGISRTSVLQNRYRLRTKLELPEGSDLDTEIRRLLTDI